MTTFVVCRDGDVNEFGRGVGVTESNDRNVDIGGFFDSLGIRARVSYDDEARLFERASDVVGEIARSEAASDRNSTCMSGELKYSTLTVRTSRDDGNIRGVIDCCDDASCKDNFLPGSSGSASAETYFENQEASYQVLPMLMTLIPSGRVFHKYGSM